MTSFLEQAIARAGLMPLLSQRRAGDIDAIVATMATWRKADLMVLGAIADLIRAEEAGATVRIHREPAEDVLWVSAAETGLGLLREVAVVRIAGPRAARVGVDWERHGLELAQVSLGFGATDLRGPIAKKSGVVILEDEKKKVKKQGLVTLSSLKKMEIAALVRHAGRVPQFDHETQEPHAEGESHVDLHP